jgi:hypothetical protein
VPQSIPRDLARDHVLKALADLDRGVSHDFGEPTKFEVLYKGKRYAPKAVIGLACRYLTGRVWRHTEFSSGKAPGQACYVLEQLGFIVVRKGQPAEGEGKDWSKDEVAHVVTDYFDMLRQELLGETYNKTDHRNALRPKLAGRSGPSIEFKHANISAVLVNLGLPYIDGYKPRGNYQGLLAHAVKSYLNEHPDYLESLTTAPVVSPTKAPTISWASPKKLFDKPPDRVVLPKPGKPWLTRKGRQVDFAERDAANRRLGRLGEEFVVELERRLLTAAGRDDLVCKVDWVTRSLGDGLGYDVLSFSLVDGSEQLLEVKTTGLGKFFPFYVTGTEVRCSEDTATRYHLYRVFDFSRDPRVYVLSGSLRDTCRLEPVQFLAGI